MLVVKLAWRSLWRNRRRTLITVSSIGMGLAYALFFITLADGMYAKVVEDAVRMQAGHITVEHPRYRDAPAIDRYVGSVSAIERVAAGIPEIQQLKPMIVGQAVVTTAHGSAGVGLIGVEPEAEQRTSPIAREVTAGRYLRSGDRRGVVVGARLAERLELEVGKKLVVTTNDAEGELVSELLRVTGIFEVGMEEADGFLIQVPLDVGRRIYGLGPDQATQVGAVLTSPEHQDEVLTELRRGLDGAPVAVWPWQEVLPDLASFIAVDKGSNYVFQGIIFFLIAFTILNTIVMSVLERRREFATLMAIGTSPGRLRGQIVVESALLGLVGCAVGLAVGGPLSYLMEVRGLDLRIFLDEGWSVSGFAVDPVIRNQLTLGHMVWLSAIVFAVTLLIGLLPALRATQVPIADALRSR